MNAFENKKNKNKILMHTSKRYANLSRKQKKIIDKIHKLIVKEFKLHVNCHIKISKKLQPSPSLIVHSRVLNNS